MDVDTLLTRQMELHTSVRQPPKSPQDLVQLMDIMRNYKHYFESLRTLAERFGVERETVFQSFMYISVGGTVNFDRQHQDGAVPMHQAKVLARSNAIELAPTLRKELPNSELMVYVGLSRDLRTTLRVKVEDGNDLKTAEKSVCEAVEYLSYIHHRAHHNPERLYALYMAEDPSSLASLLGDGDTSSMTASTATFQDTLSGTQTGMLLPTLIGDDGGVQQRESEPTPLPSPLSTFLPELKRQCAVAGETSSASGAATRRLKAAQVLLDWVTAVPTEYLSSHAESITGTVSSTLALLASEKRSALCRVGCDVIVMLLQRLSAEPVFMEDVHRGTCSTNPATFSGALALWVSSLAKGTYVTIAAISCATDTALRAVAIQSHGHLCVVRALLTALSSGAQTELRRKCLGYLALCAAAAHRHRPERMRELLQLLSPTAVSYVSIGDSPSRKMARALCSVLRVLAPAGSPGGSSAVLRISDERIEHLVQQERPQVEPAVLGGPQELEELLFDADTFVSSIRSTFSAGSQRSLPGSSMRGRGGRGQSAGQAGDWGGRGRQRTSGAASGWSPFVDGAAGGGAADHRGVVRSPVRQHSTTSTTSHTSTMGELRSPTRRSAGAAAAAPLHAERGRARHVAGSRGELQDSGASLTSLDVAGAARRHNVPGDIYDAEAYLSGPDSTPLAVTKRGVADDAAAAFRSTQGSRRTSAAHAPPPHDGGGPGSSGAAAGHHVSLPAIGTMPRRGAPAVSGEEEEEAEEGVLPPPRGAVVLSSDRLVPISLRDHGVHDTEDVHLGRVSPAPSGATGPPAPRMSQALRRKIEENKGGRGPS
ncbi:hypothetical protein NESM_000469700 [Novymonas esmeraldas]|uniref:Uncharacterized protein n=1 Tax=Novymonas esmeraldas TaxID=1808958 RepID=A0AAW0ER63_9TRYP